MTTPIIEVHLTPDSLSQALRTDVRIGLTSAPKELPPKWFYDDAGSELFDRITRLPEYYPTEREREILAAHADEIAAVSGADTLVELGSGTSDKTRRLLDAFSATGQLQTFAPLDVSEATLRRTAAELAAAYPDLLVHGVVGDFDHHLDLLPMGQRCMIAFLGSTIGNYRPAARQVLLKKLAQVMRPGDTLLLGTDLVKDPGRLVAAYDDSAGVTAAFNRNVLAVINRELGADFDLGAFDHVALYDPVEQWIEMRLRSTRAQTIVVSGLDLVVEFDNGEEMLTEVSAKFTTHGLRTELEAEGLELLHLWTDPAGDFALSLSALSNR